ncbi:MAG: potassium transporter TrkG, partial [Candidatus Eisenbacteria bacterium]
GFSTFSTSLTGFRNDPWTLLVIAGLILIGGIGFLAMEDLYLRGRAKRGRAAARLALHTRIVLLVTAVLLLGGGALFALFEWNVSFSGLSVRAKSLNALFMSVTARTAGFNTIDYARSSDSSIFLTMILMFIGGSPGSTAGGVKTTTLGVLVVLFLARLRGSRTASFCKRTIPDETIHRATLLCVAAAGLLAAAVFVLTATEVGHVPHTATEGSILRCAFEAMSAFGTVGLSISNTASLSAGGKAVVILLMYLGRIGPLAFAAAIALRRSTKTDFHFAYEDIAVG